MWTLGCLAAIFAYGLITGCAPALADSAELHENPAVLVAPTIADDSMQNPNAARHAIDAVAAVNRPIKVRIHRTYLCGEEYRSLGLLPASRAVQAVKRPSVAFVRLSSTSTGTPTLELEERVSDLSLYCKQRAMFSMDKAGRLTLFDGPPKKEKVVRTFYQLDVRFMESRLPKEEMQRLADGIRIEDKETYYSVLSSYSDYALNASRDAMTPTRR